jgi:hypothetical protein
MRDEIQLGWEMKMRLQMKEDDVLEDESFKVHICFTYTIPDVTYTTRKMSLRLRAHLF